MDIRAKHSAFSYNNDKAKIIKGLRYSIQSKEEEKRILKKQILELETKINKMKPATENVVSVPKIRQFELSNFGQHEGDSGSIVHSAYCNDKLFSFKLYVTVKEEKIIKVDVTIPEDSALLEIQKVLDTLSEEGCPQLMLNIIDNFICLYKCRNRILEKIMIKKNIFRVFLPSFVDKKAVNFGVCSVVAQQNHPPGTLLELQWTMGFSKAFYTLAHNFSPIKIDNNHAGVRTLMQHLEETTYHAYNEKMLNIDWDVFIGSLGPF